MKRLCLAVLTCLVLVPGALWAEDALKENMDSYMGMKWGISKASYERNFKDVFKSKRKDFKRILDLRTQEVFKNPISLVFSDPSTGESSEEEEEKKKSKSENLILTGALVKIDPENFEDLLDVLKFKYGEPTGYNESQIQNAYGAILIQKVACWDNETVGRSIILTKFGVYLNQGLLEFAPFKSEEEKQRERDRLAKEREERLRQAAAVL